MSNDLFILLGFLNIVGALFVFSLDQLMRRDGKQTKIDAFTIACYIVWPIGLATHVFLYWRLVGLIFTELLNIRSILEHETTRSRNENSNS